MNSNDLKALMEAYSTVYQCEQEDELKEGVKGEKNSMRKLAAQERAAERKARGGAAPKMPGREGPSAGTSYADYQQVSIAAHDRASKKNKIIPGMAHEEVEIDEATAMAKRGYDEAPIRQRIAKSTGGGEAADRASSLEKKSTFGDAKKAKQRTDYARKQRGDFRKTTSSSPGLHVGQHKSDDAGVKAKQAARGAQRGALTPAEKKQLNREEFGLDQMVESLIERGHTEQEAYALVAQFTFSEGYQRNPEKGEKEDKKYAPVRGEKTPMPPRGDKRREDFEKWYAKQMGR